MSKKSDEIDNEYYEDKEERRLGVIKRLGIAILIILAIIIIFFLLKSCGKNEVVENDRSKSLLDAAKEYYDYNDYLLPDSIGECESVTLSELINEGLLNKTQYTNCDNENTLVKVCKLESGKIHFVPFLVCDDEKTEDKYAQWGEGTEDDVIVDSSDVKFTFQASYLNTQNTNLGEEETIWENEIKYTNYKTISTIKYYRYKDLQYTWNITTKKYYPGNKTTASDVKEYYISAPAKDYIYKDSETADAAKYFKLTDGEKDYWMKNGKKGIALKAPNTEYIYADNPISQTAYQTRIWTETSKPTEVGPTKVWYCSSATHTYQVTSFVPCEENTTNPSHTNTVRMIYSCDGGITEVGQNGTCYRCTDGSKLRTDNTSCGSYGDWSSFSSTACDTNSDLCQSTTLVAYNWYKLVGGTRKYYPSNASTAAGENTYYTSAPASGLTKDDSTTTKAWKWYKKESTTTSEYYTVAPQEGATKTTTSRWTSFTNWSTTKPASLGTKGTRTVETKNKLKIKQILGNTQDWLVFNEEYMELEELLIALQNKGYKVYSLDDITASGELKYQVKMFVRNKEVK